MAKNKKAWIRIVEAAAAIMILAALLLTISIKYSEKQEISEQMYKIQHSILTELASNENMRQAVLNSNNLKIKEFIKKRLPQAFSFDISICNLEQECRAPQIGITDKNVYVDDIVISSTLQEYNPKKLVLYTWLG